MIYLQITSGRGPAECEIAVHNVLALMIKERVNFVESCQKGSVIVAFGDQNRDYAESWIGTILWICPSPVRKNHKRKNWFIGIREINLPETEEFLLREQDLVWETKKASSKGGQAANTGSCLVRLTHSPSGITVIAEDERSQKQNKVMARSRLVEALKRQRAEAIARIEADNWTQHNQLERGNPVRTFEGARFIERT